MGPFHACTLSYDTQQATQPKTTIRDPRSSPVPHRRLMGILIRPTSLEISITLSLHSASTHNLQLVQLCHSLCATRIASEAVCAQTGSRRWLVRASLIPRILAGTPSWAMAEGHLRVQFLQSYCAVAPLHNSTLVPAYW
jgi:hypothetical protein